MAAVPDTVKVASAFNYITVAMISGVISFICFIFGGRIDVAFGGLIGEIIAYATYDFRPLLLKYS